MVYRESFEPGADHFAAGVTGPEPGVVEVCGADEVLGVVKVEDGVLPAGRDEDRVTGPLEELDTPRRRVRLAGAREDVDEEAKESTGATSTTKRPAWINQDGVVCILSTVSGLTSLGSLIFPGHECVVDRRSGMPWGRISGRRGCPPSVKLFGGVHRAQASAGSTPGRRRASGRRAARGTRRTSRLSLVYELPDLSPCRRWRSPPGESDVRCGNSTQVSVGSTWKSTPVVRPDQEGLVGV